MPDYLHTLFSYSSLHGSWGHLANNSLWLVAFGSPVAAALGGIRFGLFWLICSVAAALVHLSADPSSMVPMIGASGAVSGMMGAAARAGFRLRANQPALNLPLVLPSLFSVLRNRSVIAFLCLYLAVNVGIGSDGRGCTRNNQYCMASPYWRTWSQVSCCFRSCSDAGKHDHDLCLYLASLERNFCSRPLSVRQGQSGAAALFGLGYWEVTYVIGQIDTCGKRYRSSDCHKKHDSGGSGCLAGAGTESAHWSSLTNPAQSKALFPSVMSFATLPKTVRGYGAKGCDGHDRQCQGLHESHTVNDVMEIMTRGRFRHMPVERDGKLIGVISIGDVVKTED